MKASVFIAVSLDGFIARENGDIDWLENHESDEEEDYGFVDFMKSVDVLVMGRNTWEKLLSFNTWPYGDKPLVILSSRTVNIPEHLSGTVESANLSPSGLMEKLSERGLSHAYVDGGKTIRGFLNAGLIQRLIITTIPVLLGSGIPLFGYLSHDIKWKHIRTTSYQNGFVQSEYKVLK
jgi:dihydrofolate reductase